MWRAALIVAGLAAGCDDDASTVHDAADPDAAITDGGVIDADCVMDPVTSVQLMNACTTAQRIEKHLVLPLRLEDGGLPPLP